MGCGILRGRKGPEEEWELKESGHPQYDSLIQRLEGSLLTLSEAREELRKARLIFEKEVGIHRLLLNPTVFDAMMAMLFCFSTSGEGYLENVDFALTTNPPYFTLNENLLYLEHRRIYPAWSRLTILADRIPRVLSPLERRLTVAIEESASNLYADIAGDETLRLTREQRTVSSNHTKLAQAPSLLEDLFAQTHDIMNTAEALPKILSEAHEALVAIGKQAYIDQTLAPRDIIEKFWPSARSKKGA